MAMSENESQTIPETLHPKEKGSWLSFFAKLFFFLAVILVVLFAVLSSLGGNSEVLQSAAEEFIGTRLHGVAKIDKFNQMTFFPNVSVDFEGLNVSRNAADNQGTPILSAERVSIAMGFWDIALSTGKIKTLHLENMRAMPGVFLEKGLTVDRFAVIDEGDHAYIRGSGKIGVTPFELSSQLEKTGKGKRRKYEFADVRPFAVTLGRAQISGRVENIDSDTINIKGVSLGLEEPVLSGDLDLYYGGGGRLKIKGDMKFSKGSLFTPDVLLEFNEKPAKVSGNVDFSTLMYEDALNYQQGIDLFNEIKDAVKDKSTAVGGNAFDDIVLTGEIKAQSILREGARIGDASFPLVTQGGKLLAGPITGSVDVSREILGEIGFTPSENPDVLEMSAPQ